MTMQDAYQLPSSAIVLNQQRSPDVSQMGLPLPPTVTSCDQEKVRGLIGLSNKQEEDPYTRSVFLSLFVANEDVIFSPL